MTDHQRLNKCPIVGENLEDILGGIEEDAADAVQFLSAQGGAAFAFEESIGSPGSAPEDAGGIGGSDHGREILVVLGNGNLLRLVHGEQKVGSGTNDLGGGVAGEKLDAGFTEGVDVTLGGFPEAARADTGFEGLRNTAHVIFGLGFEGG